MLVDFNRCLGPHTGPPHERSILDPVGFPDASVTYLFKAATLPVKHCVKSPLVHEFREPLPRCRSQVVKLLEIFCITKNCRRLSLFASSLNRVVDRVFENTPYSFVHGLSEKWFD